METKVKTKYRVIINRAIVGQGYMTGEKMTSFGKEFYKIEFDIGGSGFYNRKYIVPLSEHK